MKSTSTYWNTLSEANSGKWEAIEGSDGNLSQLTIAEDSVTGDYTRLTKFKGGYNTKIFGVKDHAYPEEIFIVYGHGFTMKLLAFGWNKEHMQVGLQVKLTDHFTQKVMYLF